MLLHFNAFSFPEVANRLPKRLHLPAFQWFWLHVDSHKKSPQLVVSGGLKWVQGQDLNL